MKRILCSFVIGCISLYLAATVFSDSQWIGPILITLFVSSLLYSLVMLYKQKPSIGQIVLEFILNLLMWP